MLMWRITIERNGLGQAQAPILDALATGDADVHDCKQVLPREELSEREPGKGPSAIACNQSNAQSDSTLVARGKVARASFPITPSGRYFEPPTQILVIQGPANQPRPKTQGFALDTQQCIQFSLYFSHRNRQGHLQS